MEKSGFAIGEEAQLILDIKNQSHRDINKVTVFLCEEVKCSADR